MRVAGISIITPSNANVATISIIAIDVVFVLPVIDPLLNGCEPFFLLSSSTIMFHYQATFRAYDKE
jgi:hypothetical protein